MDGIYDFVKNSGIEEKNIHVRVGIKNKRENIINNDIPDFDFAYTTESEVALWRDSSNRLVQSTIMTETPYVSYVNYFTEPDDIIGMNGLSEYKKYENKVFDDCCVEFEMAYEKSDLELLRSLSLLCCVRRYNYPSGKTVVIPFVILRGIKGDKAEQFFLSISKILKNNNLKYLSELFAVKLKKDSDSFSKYRFNMLTMLISYLYSLHLYGEGAELDGEGILKYSLLEKREEILDELKSISCSQADAILASKNNFQDFIYYSKTIDSNYYNELKTEIDSLENVNEEVEYVSKWSDLVYKNFCIDEKRAKNGEPRYNGLPLDYIITNDKIKYKEHLIGYIIGCFDIGRIAYSANISKDNKCICNYLFPGEQAYRTIFMQNLDELQCLYRVLKERTDLETQEDSLDSFYAYIASGDAKTLSTRRNNFLRIIKIISENIDDNMLETLMRPVKNVDLFYETEEYIDRHREEINV